jgi:hypothetical protein
VDLAYADRVTLAVAVLGRHALTPSSASGSNDFLRVTGEALPLFGLSSGRPDFYELSPGGRVNVWSDTVVAFGDVLPPR